MNSIVTIVGKVLAGGLAIALAAAPLAARAAEADAVLTVSITGPRDEGLGSADPDSGAITIGQTKAYSFKIANAGPSTATGLTLARPALDPKLQIVEVRGCSLHVTDTVKHTIDPTLDAAWPCVVANLQDGTSATVTVVVNYKASIVPGWPKTLPATCPATDAAYALTATSVTIAAANLAPASVATASVETPTAPVADVVLDITSGPFAIGKPVTFTVKSTNNGPCTAADVWVNDIDGVSAFVPPPPYTKDGTSKAGTWVFVSSTGDATALSPDCEAIWDGCEFGDIPAGESRTQTLVYTPQALPSSDIMQSTMPFGLNSWSGLLPYDYGVANGQTYDPHPSDNTVANKHVVTKSVGCSTGGAPGALGLLLLALLPLTRRRRSA